MQKRLLEELALAGPEHLDDAYVAAYDHKASVDPSHDVEQFRSLGLNSESTVIDIGAGTGTFALAVAPFCKRVIAVDVSPAMIEALRAKAEEQDAMNVECVQAGFLSYAHAGAPADFIYTRNALHHLPDFWKAVALNRIGRASPRRRNVAPARPRFLVRAGRRRSGDRAVARPGSG
jgi:SAM-dependent methyltransferase